MARTEGRGGGGGPESGMPESTGPASGCPPPSVQEVRNPQLSGPPSPPPPLTPSLQETAPTRAVTITAAAQRPALLMSVVVRPACAPAHRPARLPSQGVGRWGCPPG